MAAMTLFLENCLGPKVSPVLSETLFNPSKTLVGVCCIGGIGIVHWHPTAQNLKDSRPSAILLWCSCMRGIPSRWAECPDVFHRIHIHQWSALGDPKADWGRTGGLPCHPKFFRVCFCCGISQICTTFRQDITLELLSYKADVECFSHSTS